LRDLLAQRLYSLCCGYEDLNDHKALRSDVLKASSWTRASSPLFDVRGTNPYLALLR